MLIANWMTKDPVTVNPDVSMMRAGKIMREKEIRRLPVVDENNVVIGIVTDRDVKQASPSKATTLDIHEMYYLLSEIKVKDIMTLNPATLTDEDTIERAALLMLKMKVSGFPIVDADQKLVGLITEYDVFKVLTSITGIQHGGLQIGFELGTEEGSLQKLLDDLSEKNIRIMSLQTSYELSPESKRQVYIRIQDMDRGKEEDILAELQEKYEVLFHVRDFVPDDEENPLA
jgi:acetoin utilization protein AcuB